MNHIAAEATGTRVSLPLTPFEHSFVADDRDGYPGIFFVRLSFDGVLDEQALRDAVGATAARHPLLCAVLSGKASDPTRLLRWETGAPAPYVDWKDDDSPFVYPGSRYGEIDLAREHGLRLFARRGEGGTVLTLQVHHACADGTGALQFLEDVLTFYANAQSGAGNAVPLPALDPAKLAARGSYHLSDADRRARRKLDLMCALKAFSFVPRAIAGNPGSHIDEARLGNLYPAASLVELSGPEFSELRLAAKALGGTLNDLLLRDLFLGIDAWNRAQHPRGESRAIRLGMPVNLRSPEDRSMPAANVVSMYFIDRRAGAFKDPDVLYGGIVRETRFVKSNNMGLAYIRVCTLLGKVRGLLRAFLTSPVPECGSTVSLSNLGVVFSDSALPRSEQKIDIGSARLARVELMPPIRPHTCGALGVASYDGRMAITLHYDARRLTREDADALLALYRARLGETVESVARARRQPGATVAAAP